MEHPITLIDKAQNALESKNYIEAARLCDKAYELNFEEYISECNEVRELPPEKAHLIPGYKRRLESHVKSLESIRLAKLDILDKIHQKPL